MNKLSHQHKPKKFENNNLNAIGSTPIVRLKKIVPKDAAEVWIKLEGLNFIFIKRILLFIILKIKNLKNTRKFLYVNFD